MGGGAICPCFRPPIVGCRNKLFQRKNHHLKKTASHHVKTQGFSRDLPTGCKKTWKPQTLESGGYVPCLLPRVAPTSIWLLRLYPHQATIQWTNQNPRHAPIRHIPQPQKKQTRRFGQDSNGFNHPSSIIHPLSTIVTQEVSPGTALMDQVDVAP